MAEGPVVAESTKGPTDITHVEPAVRATDTSAPRRAAPPCELVGTRRQQASLLGVADKTAVVLLQNLLYILWNTHGTLPSRSITCRDGTECGHPNLMLFLFAGWLRSDCHEPRGTARPFPWRASAMAWCLPRIRYCRRPTVSQVWPQTPLGAARRSSPVGQVARFKVCPGLGALTGLNGLTVRAASEAGPSAAA
jgi:hypothetical protein